MVHERSSASASCLIHLNMGDKEEQHTLLNAYITHFHPYNARFKLYCYTCRRPQLHVRGMRLGI